jgi:hypothetical protein
VSDIRSCGNDTKVLRDPDPEIAPRVLVALMVWWLWSNFSSHLVDSSSLDHKDLKKDPEPKSKKLWILHGDGMDLFSPHEILFGDSQNYC